MKLKLDENLGSRGADILRNAGHDVATVQGQGMCSAADRHLLDVCTQEGRCLVTLDLDFANTTVFHPEAHAGIAVLRFTGRITLAELSRRMLVLAATLEKVAIQEKLWIVDPARIRIYEPDI